MPTTKEYFDRIQQKLSGIEGISYRKMMGEYLVYYKDKVAGGLCDDRFLVKPVKSAGELLTDAEPELPYEGAKPMLRVDDSVSGEFILRLFEAMYDELPQPKHKGNTV